MITEISIVFIALYISYLTLFQTYACCSHCSASQFQFRYIYIYIYTALSDFKIDSVLLTWQAYIYIYIYCYTIDKFFIFEFITISSMKMSLFYDKVKLYTSICKLNDLCSPSNVGSTFHINHKYFTNTGFSRLLGYVFRPKI